MESAEKSGAGYSPLAVAMVVALGYFLQGLDGTILNTSLPQMAAALRVGPVDMNAGVTSYVLSMAIFTPLSGWLADRYGAKAVFASAIAIFTAASIGCAAATTLPMFVAARVVQGVGGALMIPVGRIAVLRSSKTSELMRTTAMISWPSLFAPVIGPVLGGAITTYFGWRWNFFINVPIGLIGIGLALAFIPDFREPNRRPLDLVGAAVCGAGLFLLVYGVDRLAGGGAMFVPLILIAAGLGCGAGAVAWFRSQPWPLLNLDAVRVRTFRTASVEGGSLFNLAISGTPFLIPLMLQTVWGYDPLRTGWWLLVYFLGNLLMKSITTPVLRRWGFRTVMLVNGTAIGLVTAACGFLAPSMGPWVVASVFFAAGAVRSMQFTALNTLAFADVPPELRASGVTLSSMLQQLAAALGVALVAVVLGVLQVSRGDSVPQQSDFQAAFLLTGGLALMGVAFCLGLPRDAGAEVSGHRRRA